MVTYVVLSKFTDQGIRNAKDSPKRADAFKQMAKTARNAKLVETVLSVSVIDTRLSLAQIGKAQPSRMSALRQQRPFVNRQRTD